MERGRNKERSSEKAMVGREREEYRKFMNSKHSGSTRVGPNVSGLNNFF